MENSVKQRIFVKSRVIKFENEKPANYETTQDVLVVEKIPFKDLLISAIKEFPQDVGYTNIHFLAHGIPLPTATYPGQIPNFQEIITESAKNRVMPGTNASIDYLDGPIKFYLDHLKQGGNPLLISSPYKEIDSNPQLLQGGKIHHLQVNFGDSPVIAMPGFKKFREEGDLLDNLLNEGYVPICGELGFETSARSKFHFSTAGHGSDTNRLEIELLDSGCDSGFSTLNRLNWFSDLLKTYSDNLK